MSAHQTQRYIYGLKCPIDGLIHYIGASKNPSARFYGHVSYPANSGVAAWVADLKSKNLYPELAVLGHAHGSEGDWRFIEQQFIARYLALGHPLLNVVIEMALSTNKALSANNTANNTDTFGRNLKTLRVRRMMTQMKLSALLGMDATYLSRIESDAPNHLPRTPIIQRIIRALKLTQAESDALFILANRVPPDVKKKLLSSPQLLEKVRGA